MTFIIVKGEHVIRQIFNNLQLSINRKLKATFKCQSARYHVVLLLITATIATEREISCLLGEKKNQFARVALLHSQSAARQVLIGSTGKRTSGETRREIAVCRSAVGVSHDMRRLL